MTRKYHFYTDEQLEYLKDISPKHTNKEITELFNNKFNLNQSVRIISEYRRKHNIPSKYTNAQELNEDGTFKKGGVSWNKGVKGYMGANKTSFKKGNRPHNWLPVGSERVNGDDYVDIKIENPNKWKGKHILIWEEENGPVPEGHAVIFGDRNNRNFDINNLILVSRSQLLTLNSKRLIQNDADLTRTAVIIADLHHKMSDRKKKK